MSRRRGRAPHRGASPHDWYGRCGVVRDGTGTEELDPSTDPRRCPGRQPIDRVSDVTPDTILHNGAVRTVDPRRPTAEAVSVSGNHIVAVGANESVVPTRGPDTRMIDLDGAMVLPGFIDAHTHFENAVRGYFHLRLNGTNDPETLLRQIADRHRELPPGEWLTGGDWSARANASSGLAANAARSFAPSLDAVDDITPDRPVLIRRFDGSYFLNSCGSDLFHLSATTPDPPGGAYERDERGRLTGMLHGTAGPRAMAMLPPHNRRRALVGARAMVGMLNRLGIVGIHDIARIPEISDRQHFPTNVERSATDASLFTDLRTEGSLTLRINTLLTLRTWEDLEAAGIVPNSGDDWIRHSALKAFIGGFLMFRPFRNDPDFSGSLSFRNRDALQLRAEMAAADAAGWDIGVHVTGDRGHDLVLTSLEDAASVNPPRIRRHRLIHAWYPRASEIQRAGTLGMFADITPYHLLRERSSMDAKLYPDQLPTAFAWRDMIEAGIRINIVSDWPGSFDGNHEAPVDPMVNMHTALTRHPIGRPDDAFHPSQALTIDEAIAAYTINPAAVTGEEAVKGSITPGKLADLVVLSNDIRSGMPDALLETTVTMTMVDGRIVHGETP
jgi:predicted amidohydrolase YtcJ